MTMMIKVAAVQKVACVGKIKFEIHKENLVFTTLIVRTERYLQRYRSIGVNQPV